MKILKHARTSRRLTLEQAAQLVETSPGNLSRIERCLQEPSLALARRLRDFYGVSLDEIFSQEEASSSNSTEEAA